MEVLAIFTQVLREVADPGGKQSDLHFTGSSVLFVDLIIFNDFDFV